MAPKIPDDSRDWNSLDIYVFTNGQRFTPPRKFHFHSDELKIWDSTLKLIARSQYGSLHSVVELYSVEGKKVEGPLELSNEAAYVAVIPPEPFIQSGYDKYLLKASRSWEKRQGKRFNEDSKNAQEQIRLGMNSNLNEIPKKINNFTINKDKTNTKAKIMKHLPPIRPASNKSTPKNSIERRKVLNSRNTLLRKINNHNSDKFQNSLQSLEGTEPVLRACSPVKQETFNEESPDCTPAIDEIFETSFPEIQQNRTDNDSSDIKNSNREVYEKTNTTKHNATPETVYRNLESVEKNENFMNHDPETLSPLNNIDVKHDKDNNYINVIDRTSKSEKYGYMHHTSAAKNSDTLDKTLDSDTKECVINFNLNIKLKDSALKIDSDIFKKSYRINTNKHSQTNLQVDLDKDVILNKESYLNHLHTMKSFVGNSCLGCENKVIVVRCSCRDVVNGNQSIVVNEITQRNIQGSKEFVILLPQNSNVTERKQDHLNISGVNNDNNDEEKLMDSRTAKEDMTNEHKVSISTYNPLIYEPSVNPSNEQMENENKGTLQTVTNSSQTTWCDTLVEARCDEVGCYSFFLPSLEKLKELHL